MSDTQSTRNDDDLLVSVEVMSCVTDRAGAADPLAAAAADIAWDVAPGTETHPGV
ncbi:hypothetical protein PV394_19575 [Streptomyces sp. NE06-03E]|uniref:hypothetical protein n=1 Tax=unclassified Streptomyces TaxID=2593676 RepID=UPI0029BCBA94|nr:hypothetical protein [Streptomyces sp. NE06-03E]MDX3057316.1 hypothetical protein [Streptomyces sp. NE06-03E]